MAAPTESHGSEHSAKLLGFHEMGLDDRILQAVSKLGWKEPTLIQEKAIPLSLEGKDVLARARTGSGKTASYAIPVIQKILDRKQVTREQCISTIIMVPTKELGAQAHKNILELTTSCSREVRCVDISGKGDLPSQRPLLSENPDIVVGTPSKILAHLVARNMSVKDSLQFLVIDEADLVFSFGYEDDIKELLKHLPKIFQTFLMSATLNDDVKALKKLVLHNPVILKLEESQLPEAGQLTQYHIKCEEVEKFVLIYSLLKLRLIQGKSIIFVNSVDRCYRLKLFLEQFGIPACVLNSELPINSRVHIVHQFNDGLYDIVVAADDQTLLDPAQTSAAPSKKQKRKYQDKEFGVSRGIDFQFVTSVINFDFPSNVDSYIHRVGRTARGTNQGTALSFISVAEMPMYEEVQETLSKTSPEGADSFKPYQFRMEEIEGFRYRAQDAMRAVTKVAIREARLKEIKQEILNSQKLKSYFEDNPRDLQVLKHDKPLHTVRTQQHLKHVPEYLVPPMLRSMRAGTKRRQPHAYKPKPAPTQTQMRFKKKKEDPLKSFEFSGLKHIQNAKKFKKKKH
ncbi:PREDICTED: probable ATP-dependent RNA helicase DDX56 [Priapulus caudatus]|uniref:RNA helicase n=1 Tax=Priapulus caudatus TaxID=37621 RepID=A0ABM1EP37_PRICU|nr:PREDICTED: probable ATP-dependent RNA helicase DDX56 [Priapulus caudatus]